MASAPPYAADTEGGDEPVEIVTKELPFPPLTKAHILHCSYHYWHPIYRSITPKARLIPLTDAFLDYLRADGIVLPPHKVVSDADSGVYSISDEEDDEDEDPSVQWAEIHSQVKATIEELGGKVTPKLNWSAPKDATWISATNDMECRSPNDIYILLKSSDFVTHDLEHAFDGCVSDAEARKIIQTQRLGREDLSQPKSPKGEEPPKIPYHLVLRKYINLNPSLEFRCFVRNRQLLCLCQRDLNHFEFLFGLRDELREKIQSFFDEKLRDTFPDPDFVFDVYVPPPHNRVWLMDINPWAPRTDPLLFSWLEILEMEGPDPDKVPGSVGGDQNTVRIMFNKTPQQQPDTTLDPDHTNIPQEEDSDDDSASDSEIEDLPFIPELRLVRHDDPEAYGFTTPRYSAHKLPKEVVDASRSGPGGMGEFLGQWQDVLARKIQEDDEAEKAEKA
ncbi:hypothetical protein FQN55_009244 [Onygenales sp. PD_40]|nr:hypothetical protein FQN55_009244 [Onygenales sp. PD_40]KAK2773565.1 hypothetical protein FQN53_004102 [Emmonsiellopsis sp. PD_33]KAK2798670.1 hypothetical protein FQN51_007531 [Onygenales sp. PD_10]